MGLFDFEENFAFFGSYHQNPVNIVFHIVFVWPIAFMLLVLFYFTPPLFRHDPVQLWDQSFLIFNYGFLLTVIYASYYVFLDKKAGPFAAFLCFLCWVGSSALAGRLGFSLAWKVSVASELLCLTGQFIGHSLFEVLQSAFGYEPYPGFNARVNTRIDAQIKDWNKKKKKKIS